MKNIYLNTVARVCNTLLGCMVLLTLSNGPAWAQWSSDPTVNTPICTAPGDQYLATDGWIYLRDYASVPDGSGGAIVTWSDTRSGDRNIYAQRVDVTGVAQWTPDGVAICTVTGWQNAPTIVPDGNGGAIITWYDNRNFTYAQRVDASGVVQWTPDGEAVGIKGSGTAIVSDGSGGAILTWAGSTGNGDIYAQRVNASGYPNGRQMEWLSVLITVLKPRKA